MLVDRSGFSPVVARSARVASTASVVGNVVIGDGCVVDYGAVITSSGPPVRLADGVVVMANAVVRSVGGARRPAYPVLIGPNSLVGPAATLAGCDMGQAVYVATQAMVFHGARVGDGCRLGAGSIVHTHATVPARTRVGMRQFAVPDASGGGVVITSDVTLARAHLSRADFFTQVFDVADDDLVELHRRSVEVLRQEASGWDDLRTKSLPGVGESADRSHGAG